ncbi:MAG: DUF4333 domain-containing protein [Aeromicrobium sp.]
MGLIRRVPPWLLIALPICLFIGVATVLAIWHDNRHPESDHVARMAATAIARDTGRPVKTVSCPRQVDFESGDQIRCDVAFEDGSSYVTTATIDMHGDKVRTIRARFTLPFHAVPVNPAATRGAGAGQMKDIQDCVAKAGTDAAKLQACLN